MRAVMLFQPGDLSGGAAPQRVDVSATAGSAGVGLATCRATVRAAGPPAGRGGGSEPVIR